MFFSLCLIAIASNLVAMASNLIAVASSLLANYIRPFFFFFFLFSSSLQNHAFLMLKPHANTAPRLISDIVEEILREMSHVFFILAEEMSLSM